MNEFGLNDYMGATTKIGFEEFRKLQEAAAEAVRYELDEGELILTPSPTPRHDLVAFRLRTLLSVFVKKHHSGLVVGEIDFRLSSETIRKPDIAFIAKEHIQSVDLDHTPVECAPTLAVEVISPSNFAQDTVKKVHQYLASGAQAVWLVFPPLQIIEIHDRSGIREITAPESLIEERLFPGLNFSLSLRDLFDDDPQR